jgi:pantoate--beta-alanine ligase
VLQARTREQLWSALEPWRGAGERLALVPTMGNLHAGHLALIDAVRPHADRIVCSIYVNPTQFGEGEDFTRYPRTPEADLEMLAAGRCDLAFLPDDETMYPGGQANATHVRAAPALAGRLEGAARPGHFDGVVTVVARLLNLCRPHVAAFGQKDFQQLRVIERMVDDLGYPVKVLGVPTVREPDGLALSSRNRYLDDASRQRAGVMSEVLALAAERTALVLLRSRNENGAEAAEGFERIEHKAREGLEQKGFRVDYVAVRRSLDLARPGPGDTDLRVLAAAWLGETRLIDNRPVS